LGPLGIVATNMPIVPAPADYDDEKLVEWLARETELLGENLRHKSRLFRDSSNVYWNTHARPWTEPAGTSCAVSVP
jgi:hypothetical protein